MEATKKPTVKPVLPGQKKVNPESMEKKLAKLQIFYRYHLASIYRQVRLPLYERLLQLQKQKKPQRLPALTKTVEQLIQVLYKHANLNSKYRHRDKVRFERTPLLKYIRYDFAKLKEKLNSKKHMEIYDDIHDSDQDQVTKIQYDHDPHFNQDSLKKYKKKNDINGKVILAVGYQDLRNRLIDQYGWTQNPDHSSLMYDLVMRSKKKHIDYVNLLDSQYVCHFQDNKAITAKFGLTRNIRNLAHLGKECAVLYPRCYDVNDIAELEDFYEDFKRTFVKSCIGKFVEQQGRIYKEQIRIMKLMLEIATQQLLPFQKKVNLLSKGQPLYIPMETWQILESWQALEKGEAIVQQALFAQAKAIWEDLKRVDPQWSLNKGNVWIVKPASMSRGRGIKTFDKLQQIFTYIIGYQTSWVVQKYIERPLILRRKKFDIRQWVVWTDFRPLRVWMYEQCYIRFCSQAYTPQDLKNRQIHLTNNSVTKGIDTAEIDGIEGNMMYEGTFAEDLQKLFGKEVFKTHIKPQMKKIIYDSLQSVIENVQYRRNTFELLGYDFMVDEELKVWLIEVNSSPTVDYSTKVTTHIVQNGLRGMADLLQHYVTKGKNYKADKQELYGGWKLI